MPSTETQGQQPGEHIGGVGSLPGPSEEQGVAVLPEERATKTTEMVRPEHREELDDLPDETKRSTGARGVGVGGATDPLKESTKSRVCTHILSMIRSTPVYPERVHNGLVTLTSLPFNSSLVFTLSVVIFLTGAG